MRRSLDLKNAFARTLAAGADLPPCDAQIAELYRYWLSIRPVPDLLPGRQHFDPIAIPSLLRLIWLAEVQRDPLRFKYRLVGTAHVEVFGTDTTGRWYDEVHPRFLGSTAYQHFFAAARAQIAFYRGPPVYVIDTDWKTIERLILPMARNGRDVDMLLGITVLDPQPASSAGG
jgi:hypothetical protein